MYELLARLLTLFNTELVVNEPVLTSIHVFDSFAMETTLKDYHIPSLIISPNGERHDPGPFSDTARQTYSIRFRLVAFSHDANAYQVDAISGTHTHLNIFRLSDMVRDILYQNKRLTDSTFEMSSKFDCTDLAVIWQGQANRFVARDIMIDYTKLELYTGGQNEQESLTPPAFEF